MKQVGNTILAKGGNHILAKRDNSAWPKGSKLSGFSIYRGVVYDTSSIERILVSIVVREKNVEKTVQAIIKAAHTGEIGDGRIFVIPIEDAVRIRTGERGDIALYNAEQEK